MIRELFQRRASEQANTLAEAQALVDDGLELDFVLGLFPDDAAWLEPLLVTVADVEAAFEGEPASYYFEASLKSAFLGAAREPKPVVPVVITAPAFSPFRTAIATMSVASTAAALGILALGFVTAGDSTPGDWNYTFKLANERFQYTTSRGDSRIDIQLAQANARVQELQEMSARGQVSSSQFEKVRLEWEELSQQLAKRPDIDNVRRAQIEGDGKAAAVVISDVTTKQPALLPQAAAASEAIENTVAVAVGGATGLPSPTPTATAPATEPPATPATPTPETPTPAASETPTPEPTETPETETETPEPGATSTQQPAELETETASPTGAP